MKKLVILLLLIPSLAFAGAITIVGSGDYTFPAGAPGPNTISSATNVSGFTNAYCLYNNNGVVGAQACSSGSVSGATASRGLFLTGTTLGLIETCTSSQILKWSGSAWACADDATATGGTGDFSTNTTASTDGEMVLFSGTGGKTAKRSSTVPSVNGLSLISAADYAAMRTALGLVIGTNVQAYDADLTTYAGITPSSNAQTLLGHTFAQMLSDIGAAASAHNHSGTYEPVINAAGIVAKFNSGTCSGYLKSDGLCDTPSGTSHDAVTIGTANGLSLSTQALSLAASTTTTPGAATAAQITELARLSAAIVAASDGNNKITMSNNTAASPTAATDEIYPEANIFKLNQNGTESSVAIGPTGTQINFSGTLTNNYLCTFATGGAISCNTNPASYLTPTGTPAGLVIASQATGDLLYASSATAWSRLGIQAAGYILSGGSTPAWSNAPQITTIELGHASDTTIARSAAGVATIEGVAITRTIVSGTSALGTSAIASGTCATVVTTTATGVATTDVVEWGFNTRISQVTGYSGAATGSLRIDAYPTSGNINFEVCNQTASSITPGAVTLNWSIRR